MSSPIRTLLHSHRIAIVGISDNPSRPSFHIAEFLRANGKQIFAVNPNLKNWQDLPCYATLDQVPGPIDLVNVFRRPEHCAEIARAAIDIGAKGIWLQSGINSAEARAIARAAGIPYVEDRCIMVELAAIGD